MRLICVGVCHVGLACRIAWEPYTIGSARTPYAPRGLQLTDEFLTNLSPMGKEHIDVRYYRENSSVC